ncbi:hypothetical protein IJ818_02160 [bacterium]|nr:hypothetical protein [bacterium]
MEKKKFLTADKKLKRELPKPDFMWGTNPVYVVGHTPEEKRKIVEKYKRGGNNNVF